MKAKPVMMDKAKKLEMRRVKNGGINNITDRLKI